MMNVFGPFSEEQKAALSLILKSAFTKWTFIGQEIALASEEQAEQFCLEDHLASVENEKRMFANATDAFLNSLIRGTADFLNSAEGNNENQ